MKMQNRKTIKTNTATIIVFLIVIPIVLSTSLLGSTVDPKIFKDGFYRYQNESTKSSIISGFNWTTNHIDNNNKIKNELLEIKRAIEENNADWIADHTPVTNPDSYMEIGGLGCIIEEIDKENYEDISYEGVISDEFDWRDVDGTDWTTSIKNQGSCESCVAFGTLGAIESVVQISVGKSFDCDLSEAFLFFCGGGECSSGLTLLEAANFLISDGVTDERCFPYNDYNMPCSDRSSNWYSRILKVSKSGYVSPNIGSIKNALLEYGPLVTSMKVYDDFSYYYGGIYEHVSGNFRGGHAVAIVGYNDNEEYWICKNSWGESWGESGWFRIKYGECEIEEDTHYFSGISGNIHPFPPFNPNPPHLDENIDTNVTLSWTCDGDPDEDDVYYNIYLARNHEPGENDMIAYRYTFPIYSTSELEKDSQYYWKIVVEDEYGSQYEGVVWSFYTIGNQPPYKPVINGPTDGKIGTEYTYTISTTDPDGDQVYYLFDWGDGTDSGWQGPYISGETVSLNHTWNKKGAYIVVGRAMDLEGHYSNWSDPIAVSMPKNKAINLSPIFLRFLNDHQNMLPILRNLLGI